MLSNLKRSLVLLTFMGAAALPVLADEGGKAYQGTWQLNMPVGVTEISRDVFDLHMTIFWWCVAIGVVVFGVMFYTMFAHRKSRGVKAANFHHSTTLELVWTAIPFAILILMAIPATSTLREIYDTDDADLDVLITGYQWKWKYEYLPREGEAGDGPNVSFFSNLATPREQINNQQEKGENYLLEVDNPLLIPKGKKVRFLVTAADVIHSWWIPDFAVKRDAIPGYINEAWTRVEEEGIYRGQCVELCGKDHGFMPIEVHVVSQEKFDSWMVEQRAAAAEIAAAASKTFTFEELFEEGKQKYATNCAACHGVDGKGGVGPAIAGSAIATGPLDPHLDIVVNGSAGNALMAAYGPQLDAASIAQILTYQRNAFGNNTGDLVQPIDVVQYKQGQ